MCIGAQEIEAAGDLVSDGVCREGLPGGRFEDWPLEESEWAAGSIHGLELPYGYCLG